jgi:tRNA pseudouridine38-40 synthase
MERYLIKICYDGTGYHGWQKQHNGISIQETLEKALKAFAHSEIPVVGAGRTDAGVHALAQYAHFDYEGSMLPYQIVLAFRRNLPDDIKVLEVQKVSSELSARYQAYERSYRYVLAKVKTPFNRNYTGFIPHLKITLEPMQEAAKRLLGMHDFSSFGRANPEVPNRICYVKSLQVTETAEYFEFHITADRFLHNMVRRIVGTLANISHFGLSPFTIDDILSDACPRQNLVTTAPASGLYLIDVKYPLTLLDGSAPTENLEQHEVNYEI